MKSKFPNIKALNYNCILFNYTNNIYLFNHDNSLVIYEEDKEKIHQNNLDKQFPNIWKLL